MVKFYTSNHTYPHPFPTVTLAFFLRYPNPHARHVSSTDTISRSFDALTQKLTTVRLHVKKSRLPPGVGKLLGMDEGGRTESFILETTVVDLKRGEMTAESRNLDWRNVLSVIERHRYARPDGFGSFAGAEGDSVAAAAAAARDESTNVSVEVTLKSHIGEQIRKQRAKWGEQASATSVMGSAGGREEEEVPVRKGWWSTWSSGAARTAIETISLQRTERSQPKAQKGMMVVLERLRKGGLVAVLEGMRVDREVEI